MGKVKVTFPKCATEPLNPSIGYWLHNIYALMHEFTIRYCRQFHDCTTGTKAATSRHCQVLQPAAAVSESLYSEEFSDKFHFSSLQALASRAGLIKIPRSALATNKFNEWSAMQDKSMNNTLW